MTWVRLDENFPDHPKVSAGGPLALAMHVAALCYCNRHLTDGFVPESVAAGLLNLEGYSMPAPSVDFEPPDVEPADWRAVVRKLVGTGQWRFVPGGYMIHDYADYQPLREDVLAKREQTREAGRQGGQARAKRNAKRNASEPLGTPLGPRLAPATPACEANGQANGQAESKPVPVPVPVPGTELEPRKTKSGKPLSDLAVARTDVERLCSHLADRVERNGSPRPTVTAKWRQAARLLLDTDKRDETQAHELIDWCQADEFWRANILGMPKFRQQYDKLRLAAARNPRQSTTAHAVQGFLRRQGVTP